MRQTVDRFDRQKDLDLYIPDTVVVAGCGGTGFWVASGLAAIGVEMIILFDKKSVGPTNLNRTLYRRSDIDRNKAEALRDYLLSRRPELLCVAAPVHCTPGELDALLSGKIIDVLFDCTDDYKAQRALYQWVTTQTGEHKRMYIRVGCTHDRYTVTDSVPDWRIEEPEEKRQCGENIPAWVAPPVIAAGKAISKLCWLHDLNETKYLGG